MIHQKHKSTEGFSMVEILISMLLLLMLSVGVLPMFMKASSNNDLGNNYMKATNYARSHLESMRDLDFDSVELTILAGEDELVTEDYFSFKDKEWKVGEPTLTDPAHWLRTTTVRQYSNQDFNDDATLNDPLPGGTATGLVHIKEVTVTIKNVADGDVSDSGKTLTLSTMKTF